MPFRINHIHIKAADPRKVADWWAAAFALQIFGDETRPFGDRFIRCRTEDGAMLVTISGARTGETLGPGNASPRHGLEHIAIEVLRLGGHVAPPFGTPVVAADGRRCRKDGLAGRDDQRAGVQIRAATFGRPGTGQMTVPGSEGSPSGLRERRRRRGGGRSGRGGGPLRDRHARFPGPLRGGISDGHGRAAIIGPWR